MKDADHPTLTTALAHFVGGPLHGARTVLRYRNPMEVTTEGTVFVYHAHKIKGPAVLKNVTTFGVIFAPQNWAADQVIAAMQEAFPNYPRLELS